LEKPFVHVLSEADHMLALAEEKGLKIAVAHQIRLAPSVSTVKALLPDLVGELIQIDTWGKMDRRAGGEDLVVLGCHIFDLARFFAGDAQWCTARVTENGREITRNDARRSQDEVGPFAGDEISAQFGMQNNVLLTYTSRSRMLETTKPYSMVLIGSKGKARVKLGFALEWEFSREGDSWVPFPGVPSSATTSQDEANAWLAEDWLSSIRAGGSKQPSCSGWNAMKAMEMVIAVFHAGLQRGRVALPLTDRSHPLE
jgi:predicted dehydrogenase